MSRLPRVNSAGQYNFPKKLRAWDIDIFAEVCYDNPCLWGYSSAGRALEWHSRGQRFDPAYLHHRKSHRKPFGLRCFSLFMGKFQTCYAKMNFAQIGFCQQKVSTNRFLTTKKAQKNRPADNWTAFPKGDSMSLCLLAR